MPAPGVRMAVSPAFMPPMILGLTVDAADPMKFNFLIDQGDQKVPAQDQEKEFKQLIKYFLASLTIPEKDLWVNLSPYEGQRIIPQAFGQTEMGRDLLGQDYVLKQITASLIYPESELGKKFWADVYKKAHEQYGTTNIPVNTFNKVWIVPDEAMVYEHDGSAFVVKSHLKVMLEEDYLALANNQTPTRGHVPQNVSPSPLPTNPALNTKAPQGNPLTDSPEINALGSQVVREIVLPALEKEVNEGKNFALLRQINNALILATWYKRALKESLLGKFYVDKAKVKGVEWGHVPRPQAGYVSPLHAPNKGDTNPPEGGFMSPESIYQRYLEAFKKGVYNFIKEDRDPYTQQIVPRKYFSGGYSLEKDGAMLSRRLQVTDKAADVPVDFAKRMDSAVSSGRIVDVAMKAEEPATAKDEAMISEEMKRENGKYRILIVDDLTSLSGLYARVLSRDGYQVETAINGEEALNKIRSNPGRYSFVFSDFEMPVMDGIELARRLQAEFPDIQMAINTSKPEEVKEAVVGLANVNNRVHFKATVANIIAVLEEDKSSFREVAGGQTPVDAAMTGSSRLHLAASAGRTVNFTEASLRGVTTLKDSLARGLKTIQDEWDVLKTGGSQLKRSRTDHVKTASEAAGTILYDYFRFSPDVRNLFLQRSGPTLTNGVADFQRSVVEFVGKIRTAGNLVDRIEDGVSISQGILDTADGALAQGQRALGLLEKIAQRRPDRAMAAERKVNNILFVDNDPTTVQTTSIYLTTMGQYHVEGATSGQRALEMLSQRSYDLVVTSSLRGEGDIGVVKFTEILAESFPKINFIIYSGDMGDAIPENVKSAAARVVPREHNSDNLLQVLREINGEKESGEALERAPTQTVPKGKLLRPKFVGDSAMTTPGGIDLNPANLNLRIKRDGKGVPLPIGRQDMGQLNNIEGLVPVIIKIVPATYVPALSELLSTVN